MILYSDASTPFGRKCLVAALERGIALDEQFVSLWNPGKFAVTNPLIQIPALETADGHVYFDSDVILQYLDTCHSGPALIPDDDRFGHLTRIHLANGVIESTLLRRMEQVRPDGEKSATFIAHLEARITRGLNRLDKLRKSATDEPLAAEDITLLCALDYVDFRHPHDWRSGAKKLAAWLEKTAERPSAKVSLPGRIEAQNSPF
ncbi:MAG: glutathione S-transferase family protein [Alphaproteobacteria bacterium]|jgi:glutathione S-transferase